MAAVTQEQSPTAAGELRRVEGTGPLQDGGTRSRLNRGLLPRTQWDLLYVLRAPLAQRPQLKGDPQVCRSPGGRLKNIHFLSFSVIGSLAGYVVTHKPDYISQPLLKMGVAMRFRLANGLEVELRQFPGILHQNSWWCPLSFSLSSWLHPPSCNWTVG